MRVIIDNNVILDVFQNREPFVQFSSKILRLVETKQLQGFITANSINFGERTPSSNAVKVEVNRCFCF